MAGNPRNPAMNPHAVGGGRGGGQKDVDEQTKDVQETAQCYDQNVGTTTLEHASTMAKCAEPAIPYKYC